MSVIDNAIKKNPLIGYTVLGLVALLGTYLVYSRVAKKQYAGRETLYYYNLSTEEVFALPSKNLPPHTLKNGEVAVFAAVYACGGSCDDEGGRQVAYLSKYSDAAHAVRSKYPEDPVPFDEVGPLLAPDKLLVATVEMARENQWVPLQSGKGGAIESVLNKPCESTGQAKQLCNP